MKPTLLISALLGSLSLLGCERSTVVNVPPAPVVQPGPAGPTGATGATGGQGEAGAPAAVIVMPPASAPAN